MSYCRWSSDNGRCDLYCYEDVRGGWTTHVAAKKVVGTPPKVDWTLLRDQSSDKFMDQYKAHLAWMKTAEMVPIGLPYDGQTFNDPTLEAFKQRLLHLREVGYRFPDDVLESVDEDLALLENAKKEP